MLAKALACDPAEQRGEMREPVSSRGRRKLSRRYDGDESSPTQNVELAADQTETGADHPTTRDWWRMEHGNDDNDHDTEQATEVCFIQLPCQWIYWQLTNG